jgi:hypothetical protein
MLFHLLSGFSSLTMLLFDCPPFISIHRMYQYSHKRHSDLWLVFRMCSVWVLARAWLPWLKSHMVFLSLSRQVPGLLPSKSIPVHHLSVILPFSVIEAGCWKCCKIAHRKEKDFLSPTS